MLRTPFVFSLLLVLSMQSLPLSAQTISGGGGFGGGGFGLGGTNGGNLGHGSRMKWHATLSEAQRWAKDEDKPVMVAIGAPDRPDDLKIIERITAWPQVVEMSLKDVAMVKLSGSLGEGKALVESLKPKTFPALVWLDKEGNAIAIQALPERANAIAAVSASWKTAMDGIDKFFKDHQGYGERLLARGKLHEAYMELSYLSAFKGPAPDKARASQDQIKERWMMLLEEGKKFPAGPMRDGFINGLRKDVANTDFAPVLEKELGTPESSPGKPAVAAKTAQPKSLGELAAGSHVSASSERSSDDTGFDTRALNGNDERLKQARTMLTEGLAAYKKATADSMDRGAERNNLLKEAKSKFDKVLELLDQTKVAKPDPQIEKLIESTSMLIYGCLKYQTLN